MRKIFFSFCLALSLISCEKSNDGKGAYSRSLYCELIALDAYKTEFLVKKSQKNWWFFMFDYKGSTVSFLEAYRLTGDWAEKLENELAVELLRRGYDGCYEVEQWVTLEIMYAGVSDRARIYSDQEIMDRKPGEDLSDLFQLHSLGRLTYPRMEVLQDERQDEHWAPQHFPIPFSEYFSKGYCPSALDRYYNLYSEVIEDCTSLHIEIPVTGLSAEGKEISVLFKGDYIADMGGNAS